TVPKEYGGAGLGILAQCIVDEELAKHRLGCYNSTLGVFGGSPPENLYLATDYQREKYLYPVLRGEKVGAFALTEPAAGSDPASMETTARRDGDHWIINGTKHFITGGDKADFALVYARTDRGKGRAGITCFIVDRDAPGFRVTQVMPVIRPYYPAQLLFEDCVVSDENRLRSEGEGFQLAQRHLGANRITYAANCIGTADLALRMAITYARQRVTFGQPLAERQAIQWMIADSAVEIHAARLMVYHAAWKHEQGKDTRHEASIVKLYATETVGRVVDRAIQIHGGIGVSKDLPLERWYREVRVKRIGEGPSEVHRMVIARNLLKGHVHQNPLEDQL
ncbi:MAG: acyl-CoA dehydrogenase family protein, partial [Candidatus Tectomicrobia bacterium]|nr:acyl-CoA dehydrogenase family protein [Candidatus Tectomicrobia bacterium]